MLTIQNYYRLCQKKIPLTNWQVEFCGERDDYYEISLINKQNGNTRKFELSRKSEYSQAGKWAYYFSENGKKLHSAITADYMKNIDNFLSGLGTILQYG
jgi:hypothetical protein